jgi:hypothetical protein
MRRVSDLTDQVLLFEYQESLRLLESLGSDCPARMYEIRAKYRDYIGEELRARGLVTSNPPSK